MADWQRLGNRVIARRIALGYRRREDLAAAIEGLSMRTLGDIEAGRREKYHPSTLATLEHALKWEPGSVNTLLDGGEATERPEVRPANGSAVAMTAGTSLTTGLRDEALVRVMRSPDIDDRTKAKIVRMLLAEQARFERERIAHAEELIQAFRDES